MMRVSIEACASRGLSVGDDHVVDDERCILCGYCAPACPDFLFRVV